MMSKNNHIRSALLGGISLAAFAAAPAWAQDTAQTLETVTVTGSRVITDTTLSPTPITTLSTEQLQVTTPSDIPDALNKLPDIIGGRTPRTQGNGSFNNGGNTLALRGFGAQRTLILLDGHRVPGSNVDGTVNVDTLPQVLMERVDIVTGGASAVYGSDAVAGVVNFVLNKKFTGFKYNFNAGISDYGDGAQYQGQLAYGTDLLGSRAHFEVAGRYRNQDMVPIKDRPYGENGQQWVQSGGGTAANPWYDVPFGRTFQQSMLGNIQCGSACPINNYTFKSPGVASPEVHGTFGGSSNLESGGDGGYTKNGTFRSKVRMGDVFGRFSMDVTPDINVYVQGAVAESEDYSRWITWVVSSSAGRPNAFFANNPYLSPATQAQLGAGVTCPAAGWKCLPLVPTPSKTNGTTPPAPPAVPYFTDASYIWTNIEGKDAPQNMYITQGLQTNHNIETGATGTLAGLSWDVYFNHAQSRQKVLNPNNTDNAKYLAAQDAVLDNGTIKCWVNTQPAYDSLYPGCVPLNVFDPAGPSQAAYNYLRTPTWWVLTQTIDDIGGTIHGGLWGLGLPAGEITAALSAEMRWNSYNMENNGLGPTDFVNCTGLRFCLSSGVNPLRWVQNTNAPVNVRNDVYEFAGEVNIPLLKDVPLVQSLSTNLAGRYANYSSFGGVYTWKIGGDWHVDDNIHFRGTTSFDIRAPVLNDLYAPANLSSTGSTDYLPTFDPSPGTHLPFSGNTRLYTSGNANLTPEQARTYTAGVALTPTFLPNFTLSVDWYMTHMTKAITNLRGDDPNVQGLCYASRPTFNSPFCSLTVRGYPVGDPLYYAANVYPAGNYPIQYFSQPFNAAVTQMEGWDIEANYRFALEDIVPGWAGDITLRNLATYQPVNFFKTLDLPSVFPTWNLAPKFRQSTFFTYTNGDFTLSLQNQFLSSTKKATNSTQVFKIPSLGSNDVLDVTVSERFDMWGASNEVYLSVSNIANTRAPLYTAGTAGLPGLFYPTAGFHDDMGRFFTLGVKGTF